MEDRGGREEGGEKEVPPTPQPPPPHCCGSGPTSTPPGQHPQPPSRSHGGTPGTPRPTATHCDPPRPVRPGRPRHNLGVSQDKQAGQGRVGGRTAHVGGAEVPGSLLWGLGLIPSVGSMGLAIGDPDTPWVWDSSVGSLGNPTHHGFGIDWFDHWGPQHITGLGSICGVIGDPNAPRGRDPSVGS